MKKLAFLFFGHMRSYDFTHQSFNFLKNSLKNKYECDVFIHTWNFLEPQTPTWHEGYLKVDNRPIDVEKIKSIYTPVNMLVEEQDIQNPDKTIFHNQCEEGVLYYQYSRYKVNELKKEHEKNNGFEYDAVVMSRPDIIYYNGLFFNELEKTEFLWMCQVFLGGASDVLYFSDTKKIDKVCQFYNHFHETKKCHNTENTLMNYLSSIHPDIDIKTSKYCMPRDWKITRSWWGKDLNPSPGTEDHRIWDRFVGQKEIESNNAYSYYRLY